MKLGLALSGGGIKGAAHVGVIQYIEELGFSIDCISGTSSGSIVAALYASGYSCQEIIDNAKQISSKYIYYIDYDIKGLFSFIFTALSRKRTKIDGFIRGEKLRKVIEQLCNQKSVYDISDVKIPLAISSVDINNSKNEIFLSMPLEVKDDSGTGYIYNIPISEAVRASCSIPVVFKPEIIKGKRLVDGGLSSIVHVNVLREMGADKVIAVNVGYSGYEKSHIDNIFEIATQSIDIMSYKLSYYELSNADVVINVIPKDIGIIDGIKIPECIKSGYNTAKSYKNEIIKNLM